MNRLTALTKDRSLIDMYARFLKFEDEMTVISVVWREAQQFIDKYEKVCNYLPIDSVISCLPTKTFYLFLFFVKQFAILNKKRALIKEWEQFSVEWVLDDHVSGAGKGKTRSDSGGSGDSPMCIKKPSIECLNARFLEEQKLLKSGKNMQSVNIEVETHSALQEQTLLAAYGEWDAMDIKNITHLPPPNKHLKSSTASTQVDLLLTSKSKNDSPKVVEHNDEDECEDDEDCDDEEEDVDDEEDEEEDDDSCSDQSSTTSTSTSNNQRGEGGRVCDCCYCEVFGHGMPAVAPTSRNYNEMRERLRMRLSKRKAEKCEKSGAQNGIPIESNCKSKDQIEKQDERDLEELINFIEGTDTTVKDKKKREKPKKKSKEKKTVDSKDVKTSTARVEKENKPISNNSNSKTAEKINNNNNKSNHKSDHKSTDQQKDMTSNVNNNNSNHCHQNSITSKTQLKEQHSSTTKPSEGLIRRDSLNAKHCADPSKPPNGIKSDYWLLDLDSIQSTPNHLNNSINGVSNGSAAKNNAKNNNNKNNKKKIKISNDKREDNHLNPNSVHNIQNNHKSNITEQIVCNGYIPHHKQNGTVVSNGLKQNNISSSPERVVDNELRHNIKQRQNTKRQTNRKKNTDEALSPGFPSIV